ncbi:MAG: HAD family hydrolase [Lachnospiraceae bacterium]|nr:HAD family hydrolase [Lachnospiraceae bacterium]
MIRAVLFDLGGTLHCADNPPGREIWFADRLLNRLADYGICLDATPEELAGRLRVNAEAYKHETEESLLELPPPVIWNDYYLKEYRIGRERLAPLAEELSFLYDYERVRVMRRPHLRETLEELQSMGLHLGLISNIISTSVAPHFLEEYGIDGFMECVILSSRTGCRKPGAEIFRVAERALHLAPEEFAYVGDTLSRDVRGVRNAGWHTAIQIENPSVAHRDVGMKELGLAPDYKIRDLQEIPGIIREINQRGNSQQYDGRGNHP